MKTKDRLALYSVDELSKQLEDEARKCMRYESRFPDCDFALISPDEVDMGIEHLSETASGWYGIKAFDPGFDSADLMLFSDYYGGGAASFCSIWEEEWYCSDVAEIIRKTILDTLQCGESATKDSMLIVDFI